MKNKVLLVLFLSVTSVMPAVAQTATFTFMDARIEEGDTAFDLVGDVVGGTVEVDLSSGDYTVTWIANEFPAFREPMSYTLNLGNQRTGQVVSLSAESLDFALVPSFTCIGNEPVLMDWENGDPVVTFGSAAEFGVDFVSGIFSLDPLMAGWGDYDEVTWSGTFVVEGGPEESDSDGDGIPDTIDASPDSDLSSTVQLLGQDTGIPNEIAGQIIDESGRTLADIIQGLESSVAESARNDGQYVQQLVKEFKLLEQAGWISPRQRAVLIKLVARN